MPEFDFKTTNTVVHRSSSDWNSCEYASVLLFSGHDEFEDWTTENTNINHRGLQRTANECAKERRKYKDLISKNNKKKF